MAVTISRVIPRGGDAGTHARIEGSGFGADIGSLSLGGVTQTPTLWTDVAVEFDVSPDAPQDGTYDLRIVHDDGVAFAISPFWVSKSDPFTANLDFQYPATEAGPTQNEDRPQRAEAAVFNRLLAMVRSLTVGASPRPWKQTWTPTAGQTVFLLSLAPSSPDLIAFFVNGIEYDRGSYFTVGGSENKTLTWVSSEFSLGIQDRVVVFYFY